VPRWGWGLRLGISIAVSLLAGLERCAEAQNTLTVASAQVGSVEKAIGYFEQTARIKPDYAKAQTKLARLRAHR